MEKEYKKGNWVLIHRISNHFGPCDFFELKDTVNNIIYPLGRGYFKVTNDPEGTISLLGEYTEEDYEKMLDEQVKNFSFL